MPRTYLQYADDLLLQALSIPGLSGEEGAIMAFLVDQLRQAGATDAVLGFDQAHRRIPHGGQIGNLVLKLPGTRPGPRRLLMAHVDTVPICRGARPVKKGKYIVPADKHTALGADDRTGTAAILAAALYVLTEKPQHPAADVPLDRARGGRSLRRSLCHDRHARPAKAGLQFRRRSDQQGHDRGHRRLSHGHTHLRHGQPCRRAPEQGVSAITIASLAIAELHREGWLGKIDKPSGCGTANVGVIQGGEATNVITPEVRVRAEARSHDPAFRRKIVKAIETAFTKAARSVKNIDGKCGAVEIEGRLDYESFRLPEDSPAVLAAEEAIRSLGGNPVRMISNGGLDANWISARGIPTVTLGCGQENPHTPAERLDCREFHRGCEIARKLATGGTRDEG